MKKYLTSFLVLLLFAGCGSRSNPQSGGPAVVIEPAFAKLKFEQPVDLQHAADGTGRLFVAEQRGVIRAFANDPNVAEAPVFLDLTDRVFMGSMEEGLLGLAFHPKFNENGYFYVYYTAQGSIDGQERDETGERRRRSVVARFQAVAPGKTVDPKTQFVILEVDQPYSNHNGGQIAFGPDGFLYIALGDGGFRADPHNNGQDTKGLLGSILRIDVDRTEKKRNYAIPPDNPFAESTKGDAPEIFAYGLRNPWRFSFDPATGKIWAGDVGQDKPYEEVDVIVKGGNYGWNIMEGFQCFEPPDNCNKEGLILPVWEYTANEGRSITGGYVYRGSKVPALQGFYLYADFVSGRVWALKEEGPNAFNYLITHNPNLYPASFGVDDAGEMYICSFDGSIYRIRAK